MRKLIWLASVLLAGAVSCAERPEVQRPLGAHRPAGSRISGQTCFEHETADGWKPIGLVFADGSRPVSGSVATKPAYFPADAGRVRIVPGCSEEAQ